MKISFISTNIYSKFNSICNNNAEEKIQYKPQISVNKVIYQNYKANYIPFLGMTNSSIQSSFNKEYEYADIGSALNLYYKDVSKYTVVLTEEQTRKLIVKVQKGDIEAQNELVAGHLKLVLKFANRYKDKGSKKGLGLEDLIQEGNIALIKAINKFDLNRKDVKFSSYAGTWIDKSILKILNVSLVKYSKDIELASKYLTVKQELTDKLSRKPSREEISAKSGLKIKQIFEIEDYLFNKPVYLEEELQNSNSSSSRGTSKYSDIIADGKNHFEEIIEVGNSEISSLSDLLNGKFNLLFPREKTLMTLLLGLDGEAPKQAAEISQILHIPVTKLPAKVDSVKSKLKALMDGSYEESPLFSNDFFDNFANLDDFREFLRKNIYHLTPDQQKVMSVFYLDGDIKVQQEVATILKRSQSFISDHKKTAINELNNRLQNYLINKTKLDEEIGIHNFIEVLRENIQYLVPEQQRIMTALYLEEEIRTDEQAANLLGYTSKYISDNKKPAINNLKKILQDSSNKKPHIDIETGIDNFIQVLKQNMDYLTSDQQRVMKTLYLNGRIMNQRKAADLLGNCTKYVQDNKKSAINDLKEIIRNPSNKKHYLDRETGIDNFIAVLKKYIGYLTPDQQRVMKALYLDGETMTPHQAAKLLDNCNKYVYDYRKSAINTLKEVIQDPSSKKPYFDIETGIDNFIEILKANMEYLTSDQQRVMKALYLEGEIRTSQQTADLLGNCRTYVQDYKKSAIEELRVIIRNPSYKKHLCREADINSFINVLNMNIEYLTPEQQRIMKTLYLEKEIKTEEQAANILGYDKKYISITRKSAMKALKEIVQKPSDKKHYIDNKTGIKNFIEVLKQNMDYLTSEQQEVMKNLYLDGKLRSAQEVADLIDKNKSTVNHHRVSAINCLKDIVQGSYKSNIDKETGIDNFIEVLKQNIYSLIQEQQEIMRILYLDGEVKTQRQAADILKVSQSTILRQKSKAIDCLKELILNKIRL